MPERTRNPVLSAYVAVVIVAGALMVVQAVAGLDGARPLGRAPWLFLLVLTLNVVAELRPMRWLSGPEGGEITASWTFSLALLCLSPHSALLSVALLAVVPDIVGRKSLSRIAFNAAQIALALGIALRISEATGSADGVWRAGGPTFGWLLSTTAGGVAAVAVNTVLTSIAIALTQQVALTRILRGAFTVNLTMDTLMVGLAPVIAGVGVRSFVLLPMLIAVAAGVYQSAKVGIASRHEAMHDLLTGLPNRRCFYEQAALALAAAQRHDREVALLLVDLDGFKAINDRLGHAMGDRTLCEAGSRLTLRRRSVDLVARLGGDEFAVLLVGSNDPGEVARRLLEDLRMPFQADGVPIGIDASIGVALFPDHAEDMETLLARADAAMYRAKATKSGVHVYDDTTDDAGVTGLGLLAELRRAIDEGELFLEYQPIIDLENARVRGVEALVRWQHPTRGVLRPDLFIPAAEQTEMVGAITERVVRIATVQAARWRDIGLDLTVSVNTSARNLGEVGFSSAVAQALLDANLPGNRLVLEITENTVTNDPIRSEAVLRQLRELGVRISIDDFGTGYSSLSRLRSLPIDEVKIDRSFVAGMRSSPGDAIIVRSIIELAMNFGLDTVAEGVEDAETLEMLKSYGCRGAQGFFFRRAGSAQAVTSYLLLTPDPTNAPLGRCDARAARFVDAGPIRLAHSEIGVDT